MLLYFENNTVTCNFCCPDWDLFPWKVRPVSLKRGCFCRARLLSLQAKSHVFHIFLCCREIVNVRRPLWNLVSWCFEPSQPQRITSGLNTLFALSPSYSFHESFYHKSCIWAYLYSTGTLHRNLHLTGWPVSLCGSTQEPALAIANTGKTRERFWKKCRWMDRKGRNKQKGEISGSKRSVYGYILTYSRL